MKDRGKKKELLKRPPELEIKEGHSSVRGGGRGKAVQGRRRVRGKRGEVTSAVSLLLLAGEGKFLFHGGEMNPEKKRGQHFLPEKRMEERR